MSPFFTLSPSSNLRFSTLPETRKPKFASRISTFPYNVRTFGVLSVLYIKNQKIPDIAKTETMMITIIFLFIYHRSSKHLNTDLHFHLKPDKLFLHPRC